MGKSTLVTRSHSHTALAEAGQRARMIQIRDKIHEARVIDLAIAMAQTGRNLFINQQSGELEGSEMLDEKTRQAYVGLLLNKLISNAVAPKEIAPEPDFGKWVDIIAEMDESSENDS